MLQASPRVGPHTHPLPLGVLAGAKCFFCYCLPLAMCGICFISKGLCTKYYKTKGLAFCWMVGLRLSRAKCGDPSPSQAQGQDDSEKQATAKANTGVLRSAQDDGEKQATAKAKAELSPTSILESEEKYYVNAIRFGIRGIRGEGLDRFFGGRGSRFDTTNRRHPG